MVEVEPGDEVYLVDDLVEMERLNTNTRVMCAELTHGESVTIEGTLSREMRPSANGEGDYRGQQKSWVLRPPRHGKMLLSTEPLPERHEKRARFWTLACAACGVLLTLGHTALYANGFWGLAMRGECCNVEVVDHRHWTTRSRNRTYHHTAIVGAVEARCDGGALETPIGTPIEEEVDAHYADGTRVPFQFEVGNARTYRLGSGVGLTSVEWWGLLVSSLVLGFGLYGRHRAALAWYEAKLNQNYPGRLD